MCSEMPYIYTSTPPGGKVARSFYWGANLPDTAARGRNRTRATWSRNEYGFTMPLRWPQLLHQITAATSGTYLLTVRQHRMNPILTFSLFNEFLCAKCVIMTLGLKLFTLILQMIINEPIRTAYTSRALPTIEWDLVAIFTGQWKTACNKKLHRVKKVHLFYCAVEKNACSEKLYRVKVLLYWLK